jgi:extracellular factor (EF) 3-hydroxypalmitic acid methyl ester biosynthesis protein
MSHAPNLNGGGKNHLPPPPPPLPRTPAGREAHVTFKTAEGIELRGVLSRMTHHSATFELYSPKTILSVSEVLTDFSINYQGQINYFGRAVIRSLVDAGAKEIGEVTLDETNWINVEAGLLARNDGHIAAEFRQFLGEWQKTYLVSPEFKVVVADMQTFLHDLQLWLDQVEINLRRVPPEQRQNLEKNVIADLAKPIILSIDTLIDRFESIVTPLPKESHPAYQAYLRRQWHPLMLTSPFGNRAYYKPLGYAGDYQMVDMMIRPPGEGDNLFAKMINIWLLGQTPAEAHRNRVAYLERKLLEEARRARTRSRKLRVFNLGCGPAGEIQRFASMPDLALPVDFCLVDFNVETLEFIKRKLESKASINRSLSFHTLRKSVNQILKDGARSSPSLGGKYEYIYCAGLFDYLADPVCKQLMTIFYEMLEPGGLIVATNASDAVNALRPFRYSMEYILDWYLIYRNRKQFLQVVPNQAGEDEVSVTADATGANLFLEVRKPENV